MGSDAMNRSQIDATAENRNDSVACASARAPAPLIGSQRSDGTQPFGPVAFGMLMVLGLVLAGCSGGNSGGDQPQAVPVAIESAPNVPVIDPNIVEVRYDGERSPAIVELIAPDGTRTPARDIDRTAEMPTEEDGFPDVHVGVEGGSSSGVETGIGIGIPIFGTESEALPPRTVTIARFLPPNMEHYRNNWREYRVELLFGPGTDEFERIELLAPEPPDLPPLTEN